MVTVTVHGNYHMGDDRSVMNAAKVCTLQVTATIATPSCLSSILQTKHQAKAIRLLRPSSWQV